VFDGSGRKIHLPHSRFMGQLDMHDLPGLNPQQAAAQGVQGDHVFAGVYPVRVNHSSGAKWPTLRKDGRGIDQTKGGGKD